MRKFTCVGQKVGTLHEGMIGEFMGSALGVHSDPGSGEVETGVGKCRTGERCSASHFVMSFALACRSSAHVVMRSGNG